MDFSIGNLGGSNSSVNSLISQLIAKKTSSMGTLLNQRTNIENSLYALRNSNLGTGSINNAYSSQISSLQDTIDKLKNQYTINTNKLSTISSLTKSYNKTVSTLDDYINSLKHPNSGDSYVSASSSNGNVAGVIANNAANPQRIELSVSQLATCSVLKSGKIAGTSITGSTKITDLFAGRYNSATNTVTSLRTDISENMKLSDLGVKSGSFKLGSRVISVDENDKVGDLINKINEDSNYTAKIDTTTGAFTISATSGNSVAITNAVGDLNVNGDFTTTTKLSDIGVKEGAYFVGGVQIDVAEGDTVGSLIDKLESEGFVTSIQNDVNNPSAKVLNITDSAGNKVSTEGTNFASVAGFTVSEGTFSINGETFTINSDTTIDDLVFEINKATNDGVGAAFKDGQIILTASKTGAVEIKVEKGSSNFTNAIGFTAGGVMNTANLVMGSDGSYVTLTGLKDTVSLTDTAKADGSGAFKTGSFLVSFTKLDATGKPTNQMLTTEIMVEENDNVESIIEKIKEQTKQTYTDEEGNEQTNYLQAEVVNGHFQVRQTAKGSGYDISVTPGSSDFTKYVGLTKEVSGSSLMNGSNTTYTGINAVTESTTFSAGSFKITASVANDPSTTETVEFTVAEGETLESVMEKINNSSLAISADLVTVGGEQRLQLKHNNTGGAYTISTESGSSNFTNVVGFTSNVSSGVSSQGSHSTLTGIVSGLDKTTTGYTAGSFSISTNKLSADGKQASNEMATATIVVDESMTMQQIMDQINSATYVDDDGNTVDMGLRADLTADGKIQITQLHNGEGFDIRVSGGTTNFTTAVGLTREVTTGVSNTATNASVTGTKVYDGTFTAGSFKVTTNKVDDSGKPTGEMISADIVINEGQTVSQLLEGINEQLSAVGLAARLVEEGGVATNRLQIYQLNSGSGFDIKIESGSTDFTEKLGFTTQVSTAVSNQGTYAYVQGTKTFGSAEDFEALTAGTFTVTTNKVDAYGNPLDEMQSIDVTVTGNYSRDVDVLASDLNMQLETIGLKAEFIDNKLTITQLNAGSGFDIKIEAGTSNITSLTGLTKEVTTGVSSTGTASYIKGNTTVSNTAYAATTADYGFTTGTFTITAGKAGELNSAVIDIELGDTVDQIIEKINGCGLGVTAYVDTDNKFVIKQNSAGADYSVSVTAGSSTFTEYVGLTSTVNTATSTTSQNATLTGTVAGLTTGTTGFDAGSFVITTNALTGGDQDGFYADANNKVSVKIDVTAADTMQSIIDKINTQGASIGISASLTADGKLQLKQLNAGSGFNISVTAGDTDFTQKVGLTSSVSVGQASQGTYTAIVGTTEFADLEVQGDWAGKFTIEVTQDGVTESVGINLGEGYCIADIIDSINSSKLDTLIRAELDDSGRFVIRATQTGSNTDIKVISDTSKFLEDAGLVSETIDIGTYAPGVNAQQFTTLKGRDNIGYSTIISAGSFKINGVNIELAEGDFSSVIAQINSYTNQTGVTARFVEQGEDSNGAYGYVELKSVYTGSEHSIYVEGGTSNFGVATGLTTESKGGGVSLGTQGTQHTVTGNNIVQKGALTEAEAIKQGYTVIKTADDFAQLETAHDGQKFYVMDDIDFSGSSVGGLRITANDLVIESYGSVLLNYSGDQSLISVVNSNSLTISGLELYNFNVNVEAGAAGGLIGIIDLGSNVSMSNVNLGDSCSITSDEHAGGLVGKNAGNLEITNCSLAFGATVSGIVAGGFVGSSQSGSTTKISYSALNCGNIYGDSTGGGAVGQATDANIYINGFRSEFSVIQPSVSSGFTNTYASNVVGRASGSSQIIITNSVINDYGYRAKNVDAFVNADDTVSVDVKNSYYCSEYGGRSDYGIASASDDLLYKKMSALTNVSAREQITSGTFIINGTSINLSGSISTAIAQINNKSSETGVSAKINEEGKVVFTSDSSFSISAGTSNFAQKIGVGGYTINASGDIDMGHDMIGNVNVSQISKNTAQAQGYTVVESAQELLQALNSSSTAKIMLIKDIDFSGVTNTYSIENFSGVLDGNGYTIKNYVSDRALINSTADGAVIRNLRIENVNTTADAILVKEANGGITLENIDVKKANVTGSAILVGSITYDTGYNGVSAFRNININSDVTLDSNTSYAGVLVGKIVHDYTNPGNPPSGSGLVVIDGTGSRYSTVIVDGVNMAGTVKAVDGGGLIGSATDGTPVMASPDESVYSNNINQANIYINNTNVSGTIQNKGGLTGGFIGESDFNVTITDSVSKARYTGTTTNVDPFIAELTTRHDIAPTVTVAGSYYLDGTNTLNTYSSTGAVAQSSSTLTSTERKMNFYNDKWGTYNIQLTNLTAQSQGYTVITSASQFVSAISNNLGGKFMLGCDIDFSGVSYTSIANFSGILDGNGYTIKNLTQSGSEMAGLFVSTTETAEIKNLTLSGFDLSASSMAATLVADAKNSCLKVENVKIVNSSLNAVNVSGLVGNAGGTGHVLINNVYVDSTVQIIGTNAGDVLNTLSGGSAVITNASANATVQATRVGKLLYGSSGHLTLDNVYTSGDISACSYSGGLLYGFQANSDDSTLSFSNTSISVGNTAVSTSYSICHSDLDTMIANSRICALDLKILDDGTGYTEHTGGERISDDWSATLFDDPGVYKDKYLILNRDGHFNFYSTDGSADFDYTDFSSGLVTVQQLINEINKTSSTHGGYAQIDDKGRFTINFTEYVMIDHWGLSELGIDGYSSDFASFGEIGSVGGLTLNTQFEGLTEGTLRFYSVTDSRDYASVYVESTDTVGDVIDKINAIDGYVAGLNNEGRMFIKTTSEYFDGVDVDYSETNFDNLVGLSNISTQYYYDTSNQLTSTLTGSLYAANETLCGYGEFKITVGDRSETFETLHGETYASVIKKINASSLGLTAYINGSNNIVIAIDDSVGYQIELEDISGNFGEVTGLATQTKYGGIAQLGVAGENTKLIGGHVVYGNYKVTAGTVNINGHNIVLTDGDLSSAIATINSQSAKTGVTAYLKYDNLVLENTQAGATPITVAQGTSNIVALTGIAGYKVDAPTVTPNGGKLNGVNQTTKCTVGEAEAMGYTLIYTADEFISKINANKSGKFMLMNSITFDSTHQLGISGFSGILDGNGYTISTKVGYASSKALFSSTSNGAEIKNLILSRFNVTNNDDPDMSALLVRSSEGSLTIDNVSITNSTLKNNASAYWVGVLVGWNSGTTVINNVKTTSTKIEGSGSGLVGLVDMGSLSVSNSSITLTLSQPGYYGSIVGEVWEGTSVNISKTTVKAGATSALVNSIQYDAKITLTDVITDGAVYKNIGSNVTSKINDVYVTTGSVGTVKTSSQITSLINNAKFYEDKTARTVRVSESSAVSKGYTVIKSAQEFMSLIQQDGATGKYMLANDIDFTGVSYTALTNFKGTLDGNGYTIKNLSSASGKGLIDSISGDATVKNLTLDGFVIEAGYSSASALVNSISAGNVTIENIVVKNTNISGVSGDLAAIVALHEGSSNLTINNVNVQDSVTITSESSNIAGIVASSWSLNGALTITNSSSAAKITNTTGDSSVGVGQIGGNIATGNIIINNVKTGGTIDVSNSQAGSVIGTANSYAIGTISNVTTLTKITDIGTGTAAQIGVVAGAVPSATVTINDISYNTSNYANPSVMVGSNSGYYVQYKNSNIDAVDLSAGYSKKTTVISDSSVVINGVNVSISAGTLEEAIEQVNKRSDETGVKAYMELNQVVFETTSSSVPCVTITQGVGNFYNRAVSSTTDKTTSTAKSVIMTGSVSGLTENTLLSGLSDGEITIFTGGNWPSSISYSSTDTVGTIVNKLNNLSNVDAYLDEQGRIVIKSISTSSIEIQFLGDKDQTTGNFLEKVGLVASTQENLSKIELGREAVNATLTGTKNVTAQTIVTNGDFYINRWGESYKITVAPGSNIQMVLDQISDIYEMTATIENGKVVIKSDRNWNGELITITDGTSNFAEIAGFTVGGEQTKEASLGENVKYVSEYTAASAEGKFSAGSFYINMTDAANNVLSTHTISVSDTDTVQSIINRINDMGIGVTAYIDDISGKMVLSRNSSDTAGGITVSKGTSDFTNKIGFTAGGEQSVDTVIGNRAVLVSGTTATNAKFTDGTFVIQFTDNSGSIQHEEVINVSSTQSVQEVADKINQLALGLNAYIDEKTDKLVIEYADEGSFNIVKGTSDFTNVMQFTSGGVETGVKQDGTNAVLTSVYNVAAAGQYSTGNFYVNGTEITVADGDSLQSILSQITEKTDVIATLDNQDRIVLTRKASEGSGSITVEKGTSDFTHKFGFTTGGQQIYTSQSGSNAVLTSGVTSLSTVVSEGYFYIERTGDNATASPIRIDIGANSTVHDVIDIINSYNNPAVHGADGVSGITASWDEVNNKIVLTRDSSSGAGGFNVIAGTTNFTKLVGFTTGGQQTAAFVDGTTAFITSANQVSLNTPVSEGDFVISFDGSTPHTITLGPNATIATAIEQINNIYGLSAKLDETTNKIVISRDGVSGAGYIEIIKGTSNFTSIAGFTSGGLQSASVVDGVNATITSTNKVNQSTKYTAGNFTVNIINPDTDATIKSISIDVEESDSILSIVDKINADTTSGFSASYDDTTGKITISLDGDQGAYALEVVKGTSNFTNVVGFTAGGASTGVFDEGESSQIIAQKSVAAAKTFSAGDFVIKLTGSNIPAKYNNPNGVTITVSETDNLQAVVDKINAVSNLGAHAYINEDNKLVIERNADAGDGGIEIIKGSSSFTVDLGLTVGGEEYEGLINSGTAAKLVSTQDVVTAQGAYTDGNFYIQMLDASGNAISGELYSIEIGKNGNTVDSINTIINNINSQNIGVVASIEDGKFVLTMKDSQDGGSFTVIKGSSDFTNIIGLTAGGGMEDGVYTPGEDATNSVLTSKDLGKKLVSDSMSLGSIGVTNGTFRINGVDINVKASDTIYDLAARINAVFSDAKYADVSVSASYENGELVIRSNSTTGLQLLVEKGSSNFTDIAQLTKDYQNSTDLGITQNGNNAHFSLNGREYDMSLTTDVNGHNMLYLDKDGNIVSSADDAAIEITMKQTGHTTIDIGRNILNDSVEKLQAFVNRFNNAMNSAANPIMSDDPDFTAFINRIKNALTNDIGYINKVTSKLAEIGIVVKVAGGTNSNMGSVQISLSKTNGKFDYVEAFYDDPQKVFDLLIGDDANPMDYSVAGAFTRLSDVLHDALDNNRNGYFKVTPRSIESQQKALKKEITSLTFDLNELKNNATGADSMQGVNEYLLQLEQQYQMINEAILSLNSQYSSSITRLILNQNNSSFNPIV